MSNADLTRKQIESVFENISSNLPSRYFLFIRKKKNKFNIEAFIKAFNSKNGLIYHGINFNGVEYICLQFKNQLPHERVQDTINSIEPKILGKLISIGNEHVKLLPSFTSDPRWTFTKEGLSSDEKLFPINFNKKRTQSSSSSPSKRNKNSKKTDPISNSIFLQ